MDQDLALLEIEMGQPALAVVFNTPALTGQFEPDRIALDIFFLKERGPVARAEVDALVDTLRSGLSHQYDEQLGPVQITENLPWDRARWIANMRQNSETPCVITLVTDHPAAAIRMLNDSFSCDGFSRDKKCVAFGINSSGDIFMPAETPSWLYLSPKMKQLTQPSHAP